MTLGFSTDSKGAHGRETAAHPPMMLQAAVTTDAGSGLDSTPATTGSSHKADPTPEEETIITQAIEMLCCDRQAVVRSSSHFELSLKPDMHIPCLCVVLVS
eukprot:COSAG02_NODE_8869_length_2416_cov_117.666811_1_plen_101_part_00